MDGLHLTADLRGCAPLQALMTRTERLRQLCLDAVGDVGLQAVGELFHRFAPARPLVGNATASGKSAAQAGITGVVLLAESHLAVHTWPELGAVTIDVYVCNFGADNTARAHRLLAALIVAFEPAAVDRQALRRGRPATDSAGP